MQLIRNQDWQTWTEKDDSGFINVLVNLPTPDAEGQDPPPASSFMITSRRDLTARDTLVIPFGAYLDPSTTFLSLLDAAHTAQVLCQEAELDKDTFASVSTVVIDDRMIPAVGHEDYSVTYDEPMCQTMRGRILSDTAIFAHLIGASLHVEADQRGAIDMGMASRGMPSSMTWKGSDFGVPVWLLDETTDSIRHTYSLDLTKLCWNRDYASLVNGFDRFLTKQGELARQMLTRGKEADILLHLHTDESNHEAAKFLEDAEFMRLYDDHSRRSGGFSEIRLQLGGEVVLPRLPYEILG